MYLDNEAYITRNYDFAISQNTIAKKELDAWKKRMLIGYYTTMQSNILLFSKTPLKDFVYAKSIVSKKYDFIIIFSSLKVAIFMVARILTKIKFFYKMMILFNNR
jgi:hypothetical protein